jgi:8-oxo-dGTP pyrophosphatase MutT (NUDIX family)
MEDEPYSPDAVRRKLAKLSHTPLHKLDEGRDFAHRDLSESAVLIPLSEHNGQLHMLFTERSHELRNHSGEISFPGGRREIEDDSLAETALRETYEEVAIRPSDVELFGALTRIPTVTGYRVTAFVGEFPHPYDLILNPAEIHLIFQAPLSELADPSIHRLEERDWGGQSYSVHYFDWRGHTIWGATGFLLHSFLEFVNGQGGF